MKRFVLALSCLVMSVAMSAQDAYERYIAKYADAAVEEMYRSGVPASITLAQGLLESGQGQSSMAVTANNHFGIKCHDWTGEKVYYDDDAKNECFRKYDSVADSYKDHSDFLRYKDRYKFLFDLETTDYKGWAYGLKKAGYATDPTYADKLIKIIERYELYKYDEGTEPETVVAQEEEIKAEPKKEEQVSQTEPKKLQAPRKQATKKTRRSIPASPSTLETLKPADGFTFSLSRKVYERNGVPCVLATEGETYGSIAEQYDLFLKEVLKYNDASSDRELLPGEVVFIKSKKAQAAKGLDKHICDTDGESLRDIAQRYGVKMESLMKLNGYEGATSVSLQEGSVVKLRK